MKRQHIQLITYLLCMSLVITAALYYGRTVSATCPVCKHDMRSIGNN